MAYLAKQLAGDAPRTAAEHEQFHRWSAPLREFFWRCWDNAREGTDVGGDDVQDWGEALGLLKRHHVSAPCGEGCNCDDVTGGDFPTDCYRPTMER